MCTDVSLIDPTMPNGGAVCMSTKDLRAAGFEVLPEDVDGDENDENGVPFCLCICDVEAVLDRRGLRWEPSDTGYDVFYGAGA